MYGACDRDVPHEHESNFLNHIPDGVFIRLVSYLSLKELSSLKRTNQSCNMKTENPQIWRARIEGYISPGMFCPFWPAQVGTPLINNPKRAYQSLVSSARDEPYIQNITQSDSFYPIAMLEIARNTRWTPS